MNHEEKVQEFQVWVYQRLELLCEEVEELRDSIDRLEAKMCPSEMDTALDFYGE